MPNTTWRITIGDYDFAIDRQSLTYDLVETKSGMIWARALPVGWIELEERSTGDRARYDFAQANLISVVEKSSHQGKRILFGLDLLGIPIDLYFICGPREIQLTVEATRDTRTHTVQGVGLLPGLVSFPDDNASYGVVPKGAGFAVYAADVPQKLVRLPIWNPGPDGLGMPFVGAVRRDEGADGSALVLMTDSAYGDFTLSRAGDGSASLDLSYSRDPERRRLEVRVAVLPDGDAVSVARAYREKLIEDRNHVTLRRKIRERPQVEKLLGSTFVRMTSSGADMGAPFASETDISFYVNLPEDEWANALDSTTLPDEAVLPISAMLASQPLMDIPSRWEDMAEKLGGIQQLVSKYRAIGSEGLNDWAALALDFWRLPKTVATPLWRSPLPLLAVVYHDSVVAVGDLDDESPTAILRCLLNLALPCFALGLSVSSEHWDQRARVVAVLGPLHQLTFSAFLTEHRFLTPDFKVEEAVYSDKTRIVINTSETEPFERDGLHLPPLGFYARHAQMEAHFALRVGTEMFATRAWRIRGARDGRRLEESADVLEQEFPV